MKIRALVGLLVIAGVEPAAADEPHKGGLTLVQPSPKPPVSRSGPVRSQLASDARTAAPPSGELSGLRAVSLLEGSGVISLAGATRPVRPGDRIGGATVKAVGSDRIILERPPAPPAGSASVASGAQIIVVTFGPGGQGRVRTYARPAEPMPSPETR